MEEEIIQEKKDKIYNFISNKDYIPMKKNEISLLLSVPSDEKYIFNEIIDELLNEGKLIETKKGKLISARSLNIVTGTFTSNAKGFGFVSTDVLGESDIFIPPHFVNGAMHKDNVMCKILFSGNENKRAEGEIIRILKRGMTQIVGTFELSPKGFGFVVPDDKKISSDIFIAKNDTKGAVTGHKVVVKITKFPQERRNAEGKVKEILGHINDPGVDILSIIYQYDLPLDFSKSIYDYIENIPSQVDEKDIIGRRDLRDLTLVTIDGEDAKDLDDAVSLEILKNGNYSLGVHIADVSHYVKENSILDKEAYMRGTSVYLVDRVIPMLPHKLSNGICSLNPDVDRLALSCVMEIDNNGNVIGHEIFESVIHSKKRMTYTAVNEIIEKNNPDVIEEYKDLSNMFIEMNKLREILANKRKKRGSVNFELPEAKILLNEDGTPLDIKPYERNSATNLIEEFMLICNETIAEDYYWQELPFMYRSHESPDNEKVESLKLFLRGLGYHIKGKGEIHPKDIQQILSNAEGTPEEHIISRTVLRSMKQARYTAENNGHFGLAAKYYCHFTSPIRRYPDLQIHRIIKENLKSGLSDKRIQQLNRKMSEKAKQCSSRERTADDAERDTDQLKKVQFMLDKIGMEFDGIVSGVTSWGIYVELYNTVEGMVSISDIGDDYYEFDEKNMMVFGRHTGNTYHLGDKVKIKVKNADMELRTIDFIFTYE